MINIESTCCGQGENFSVQAVTYLRNLATKLPKIDNIIDSWIDYKWPYHYENNSIMFHAPVGNPLILSNKHKVKIFMSGFCVSGEAGIQYVFDVINNKNKFTSPKDAALNSFNTSAMKSGITKILEDLGVNKLLNIAPEDIFKICNKENSPILFTQALCPIIIGNSWKAEQVWSILKQSEEFRKFASVSLQIWLSHVENFCNIDTKVILFGKTQNINCDGSFIERNIITGSGGELIKLLLYSFIEKGIVRITNKNQGNNSLYNKIRDRFSNNIFVVPHPAFYDIHRKNFLNDKMFRKVF